MSKPTLRGKPKAVAADFCQLINSPSTWMDTLSFPMKTSLRITTVLLCIVGLSNLCAREGVSKWDVEIPAPLKDGTRPAPLPKPEPIHFTVRSSRTIRMDVTQAPEIPGLPPVTGKINVTMQAVEDPNLPDPAPLPALPPDHPAVVARMAELAGKYRGTELVFVSATVHDRKRTLLRIHRFGEAGGDVTAWSNLDFNHFSGFSTFRVKDAIDGTLYDYGLLMGIGNEDNRRMGEFARRNGGKHMAPEIPEMPDLGRGEPTFVVVEGERESPAMATLEQLHDLYRTEGGRMEAAHHAREKNLAERKAYLLANPPKPKDVTIRVWRRNRAENPQEVSR
jgi:hypothetical protein